MLLSPVIKGGDSWQTVFWLRVWVTGFAIFYFLSQSRERVLEIKTPIRGWLILALLLVLTCSLFITHYFYITIYWYFNFIIYALLFFLTLNLFSGENKREFILSLFFILLLAGLSQSLAGIIQFFAFHPERVSGTFFNPAYYTGYLGALLAFPLAGLIFDLFPQMSSKKKLWFKILSAILSILIFLALIFSASRSIVFSLIPLCLLLVMRYRVKAVLALIALLLALTVIPNPLRSRFLNINKDPYAWERVNVWRESLTMIRHHPLGVGLGMYQYYSQRYQKPFKGIKYGRYGLLPSQAHNEFLNFSAECSLLAPLFALAFLTIVFYRAFRALKNSREDPERFGTLSAFLASVLAILGHSFVDYNLHQPPIMTLALLDLAGMVSIIAQIDASILKRKTLTINSFLRALAIALGLILIVALSYQSLMDGLLVRSVREKNTLRAISMLNNLSLLPSGNAEIYFQLGARQVRAFEKSHSVMLANQGIENLEQAVRLNHENQEYCYELARANYLLGTYFKHGENIQWAKKYSQEAIRIAPGQVYSYLLLSDIYLLEQDYISAKSALKTALEYEPYFFKARFQLIMLLSYEQNPEAEKEAEILFEQYSEVQEFLKNHPDILNFYQRQIVELSLEEINRLKPVWGKAGK